MIKSVTVINPAGEKLQMVLANPEQNGFNIYNITGIGPGEADISVSDIATGDGSVFNSSRVRTRNIVFYVKFGWVPTVEDTRHRSYKFFPVKRPIQMIFETTNRTTTIMGYVETNEPVIFEREEYAQISVICPFPFFSNEFSNNILFYTVDPMFHFPFSNDSLTEPTLIFGEIRDELVMNIFYAGDAAAGMRIVAHAIGPATNLMIYKIGTNEAMRISSERLIAITGSDIIANDQIVINTIAGQKSIYLIRNGIYTNILNALDRNADWPQLTSGDNLLAYTADEGQENIKLAIEYNLLWDGV